MTYGTRIFDFGFPILDLTAVAWALFWQSVPSLENRKSKIENPSG
jgi:hypothetical protein